MYLAQSSIHELFAEAVFQKFNSIRFGIRSCSSIVDVDEAADLRDIYMRMIEEGCDDEVKETCSCTLIKVEEKINTL